MSATPTETSLETSEAPTAVSLFSGAGGLDAGVEAAGWHVGVCLDNDLSAVQTLRHNQALRILRPDGRPYLAGAHVLHADIAKVTGAKLMSHLNGGAVDLLIGGPPCQPFSSAGKMRGLFDPRGTLFTHFVRLADELKPRYVLFENVRGLATARGSDGVAGSVLREILDQFEALGYHTNVALLNSADFGAFQRRVRLFILMAHGTTPPRFPLPTHWDPSSQAAAIAAETFSLFDQTLAPWRTLGEFLAQCPEPDPADVVRPSPRLAALLQGVPAGSGLKSAGTVETTRPGGHWGYKQGTFIADPNKPARTVTAASTQDWIRLPDGSCRRLTVAECQGLQGFPAVWEFAGSKADRYRQVGNAVPTTFGEALGRALLAHYEAWRAQGFATDPDAQSYPVPASIRSAVAYTEREHLRNGESRRQKLAKGLGSASGKA